MNEIIRDFYCTILSRDHRAKVIQVAAGTRQTFLLFRLCFLQIYKRVKINVFLLRGDTILITTI